MSTSTLKRPSALIPLAMSLTALALVLGHTAMYGTAREADEGTAAQIPFIAYFAVTWIPRAPKAALVVLGLQLFAGLAAAAPVFILQL